jgi:HJR/Mrr/RecB family endonuclease
VGNRPVQEVFAGARHHRCVEACVVAPGGYTRGAIALARSTGVSLFDADSIRQWIR